MLIEKSELLDLPPWINNYPFQIINDAGSSSVIELGKKNFILLFPYETAIGFAVHFFLKKSPFERENTKNGVRTTGEEQKFILKQCTMYKRCLTNRII